MTSETVADPPSATFDMYGNEPPPGDWSYIVDDTGTEYGPGWFPFYRSRLGEGPQSVRLAPDTAYRAWRNEYVLLGPGRARSEVEERQWAWADLTLYVRRQGMGAMVVRTIVELNIKTREIIVAPDCPDALRAQADAKAERLLALILAARADRRTRDRPITAHERWVESQPPPGSLASRPPIRVRHKSITSTTATTCGAMHSTAPTTVPTIAHRSSAAHSARSTSPDQRPARPRPRDRLDGRKIVNRRREPRTHSVIDIR